MTATLIQANYERLESIAATFGDHAARSDGLHRHLQRQADALVDGAWQGEAAQRFHAEMSNELLPALQRLATALDEAQSITLKIRDIIRAAEEEAAALFTMEAAPEAGKGFWGHFGDFFSGIWAEGKDMVTGLWTAVTHPIETAKGLWYGITHPGELWNAIKQPYVEDWNNGRPWRAIGRGTMAIVSTIFGAKGADKMAKIARGASVADDAARIATAASRIGRVPIDDVLRITSRSSDEAVRIADGVVDAANSGRSVSGLTDDLARQSAHAIDTPSGAVADRVVLGKWKQNGIEDFYIREAADGGGIVYSTGNEAWQALDHISDPVVRRHAQWEVNRSFLQQQMDGGVPRIEYVSDDMGRILSDYSATSYDDAVQFFEQGRVGPTGDVVRFRELELLYLRDNAARLGYELVDDVWIKRP
ncbi:MAG: WXG100 family type VII secretion target [Anaerolineales bacterium]|nr:WXG100 family type VII secretion target [Anaerolineales bacterium]MCB9126847.1 WXG100 family type VII secretion target [Ardenticatenales bacterium]